MCRRQGHYLVAELLLLTPPLWMCGYLLREGGDYLYRRRPPHRPPLHGEEVLVLVRRKAHQKRSNPHQSLQGQNAPNLLDL